MLLKMHIMRRNHILGDEVYESGKQVVSGLSISGQDGKHGVGQAARFPEEKTVI
jgi:hypothetical protein